MNEGPTLLVSSFQEYIDQIIHSLLWRNTATRLECHKNIKLFVKSIHRALTIGRLKYNTERNG